MQMHNPAHPGLVLREYMGELKVSELAKHIGMPRESLSRVLSGKLSVTPAIAIRLGEAFPQTSAEFWLAMQNGFDLAKMRKAKRKPIKAIRAAELVAAAS